MTHDSEAHIERAPTDLAGWQAVVCEWVDACPPGSRQSPTHSCRPAGWPRKGYDCAPLKQAVAVAVGPDLGCSRGSRVQAEAVAEAPGLGQLSARAGKPCHPKLAVATAAAVGTGTGQSCARAGKPCHPKLAVTVAAAEPTVSQGRQAGRAPTHHPMYWWWL